MNRNIAILEVINNVVYCLEPQIFGNLHTYVKVCKLNPMKPHKTIDAINSHVQQLALWGIAVECQSTEIQEFFNEHGA